MICGSKTDRLFCGHDISARFLEEIQIRGRDIYQQVTVEKCPDNVLFILEHQVYSYYYFKLDSSENPDVHLLIHGDAFTNKIIGKLSMILDKEIERLQ